VDPALQLILDMMNTCFDELDRRFTDRDRALADRAAVVDLRFIALEVNHVPPSPPRQPRWSIGSPI
jgi:hypothetical protein